MFTDNMFPLFFSEINFPSFSVMNKPFTHDIPIIKINKGRYLAWASGRQHNYYALPLEAQKEAMVAMDKGGRV
jgi:hypothetical protein